MKIYHGSYTVVEKPKILKSRFPKDFGKVYKRLIIDVGKKENKPFIDILTEIYNSWLSRKIEDFNSSIYYESPEYLLQSYLMGDTV
ncbi:hypothetical protein AGMMS50262_09990 [Bacteroidia bacterium]|nr:hypothetical protein AGMMS50262_09990 [Bacteroidia bacterium]